MKVEDITAWVDRIDQIKGDAAAARLSEDELHDAVLSAIARGQCDDPQACAAEALATRAIDFDR